MGILCGVDIIEIDRIRKSIETIGEAFRDRVFTEKEVNYCEGKKAAKYESYAARFAAKEAVSKALGTGIGKGVSWRDIEVVNDENGKPHVFLTCRAKEIFDEAGAVELSISLSHSESYAVAYAAILTV